jgi:hypothetical protein
MRRDDVILRYRQPRVWSRSQACRRPLRLVCPLLLLLAALGCSRAEQHAPVDVSRLPRVLWLDIPAAESLHIPLRGLRRGPARLELERRQDGRLVMRLGEARAADPAADERRWPKRLLLQPAAGRPADRAITLDRPVQQAAAFAALFGDRILASLYDRRGPDDFTLVLHRGWIGAYSPSQGSVQFCGHEALQAARAPAADRVTLRSAVASMAVQNRHCQVPLAQARALLSGLAEHDDADLRRRARSALLKLPPAAAERPGPQPAPAPAK